MADETYAIEWRPLAINDLIEIIRYIAEDNPVRARSFGDELRVNIGHLSQFPLRGREGQIEGTRELIIHRNYIAIYRVEMTTKVVEILRLKHAAKLLP